jgi:hypothetical protein
MKYLFVFNGRPLLLCCLCCKIAIQDFVTGLHKKKLRFHQRTITRRYFTENCKKITGLCHFHRRTITRRYFTDSCKKNYGIVPPLPTDLPTAYNPSVFHRELQKQLRDCATITDVYTDGFTDIEYRWIYAYPEAHTCLTRVRLHQYRRIF